MTETNPFSNVTPDNAIDTLKELKKKDDTINEANTTLAPLDDSNVVSEVATVEVNLVTGTRTVVPDKEDDNDDYITETFEDLLENSENRSSDKKDMPISEDAVAKTLEEKFKGINFNPNEIIEFGRLVEEFRHNRDIKVYDRLPDMIKGEIDRQAMIASKGIALSNALSRGAKESVARELLDDFIFDAGTEDIMIDFNKEIEKLNQEFNDSIKELGIGEATKQSKKFRDMAEKIKEEKPDKAKQFLDIADTIDDAFRFDSLYEAAKSNKIKIRKYDIESPKNAFSSFNRKYENSVWNVYDISTIPNILRRYLDEDVSDKKIIRFTIFFINYCSNKTPDNILDHVFMYNTINAIVWLNFVNKEDNYAKDVIANIKRILDLWY